MVDSWWLAAKLLGMGKPGESISVADVQADGTILLHITRPHGMGHVEVTIKVAKDG